MYSDSVGSISRRPTGTLPARIHRWIGISTCIAAAILLATYVIMRTWSAYASSEAIAVLRRAEAMNFSADQSTAVRSAPGNDLSSSSDPNLSSWSKSRIAAYRQAVATGGAPEAVLRIPSLDLEVPVYAGTSDRNLNRGAGRIEGTARAGSAGNVGIAAHRDGFFRPLKDIRVGDVLYLDTIRTRTKYRVTATSIVAPEAVEVLNDTPQAAVTLVTCYPFYYLGAAPKRFIVRADATASDSGGRRARAGAPNDAPAQTMRLPKR